MRLLRMATIGFLIGLPFYILLFYKTPSSLGIAGAIWFLMLLYFTFFTDENGNFLF